MSVLRHTYALHLFVSLIAPAMKASNPPFAHCCTCLQVVDIMKTNVEKVLERDQKLSELDDRAGKSQ